MNDLPDDLFNPWAPVGDGFRDRVFSPADGFTASPDSSSIGILDAPSASGVAAFEIDGVHGISLDMSAPLVVAPDVVPLDRQPFPDPLHTPLRLGQGVHVVQEAPDHEQLSPQQDRREIRTSFDIDQVGDGILWIENKPPDPIELPREHAQKAETDAKSKPWEDRGWFAGLSASNRFRPEPAETFDDRHPGRPYDLLRSTRARLTSAVRSRTRIPTSVLRHAPRCTRCDGPISDSRCEKCGAEYCSLCRCELDSGKCTNRDCRNCEADRCGACGSEPCECAR